MKVNSKLVRFVKFGAVEIAPGMNELDEKQATELNAHKGFQSYVSSKELEAIKDEVKTTRKQKDIEGK